MECSNCHSTDIDCREQLPCVHSVFTENGVTIIRITDGDVGWDCGQLYMYCESCFRTWDPPEESENVMYC